ncbi:DUF4062 domain-containing protein [Pluralibacter sp.]|uniref:DUF4062 domain-containing protein n=1 Tax=Pluralibacter sp. TaxID=1920032 RepID=UPI0025EE8401|nr:DUF4062 domain-containing protein [Pluralibacter sp.]MBV8044492.1 DUF4062 domain-containing protein [Pluralibacter sp.]
MDEKKYQIFVSSTYEDLFKARKKIIETVLSLYHFPVGMEMFSADDSEQWEVIRETIEGSDYYIIIIGHRYGSVASTGLSYTEMEYDYAKSLGIPVLAFIRDRNVGTLPNERESDPQKSANLERFIEKAKANKMCNFWESMDDLATQVAIALPKAMRRTPRVGWVRGDQVTPKEVSNELAELSTENRKLREKLREYESQLTSDMPVLKLLMLEEKLILTLPEDGFEQKYIPSLNRSDVPHEYNELITHEQIDEYNNKLPSDKEIDSYNKKLFLFKCREECSHTISPTLENLGKKVASDIHIDIELPSFIAALNYDNEDIFTKKPTIDIPMSPVESERKKQQARKHIGDVRKSLLSGKYFGGSILSADLEKFTLPNVFDRIQPVNASNWISYDGNRVTLRAKKLLQSLSLTFDELTLIPISEGQGVIKFKIVCEELKEPITFSREISVAPH